MNVARMTRLTPRRSRAISSNPETTSRAPFAHKYANVDTPVACTPKSCAPASGSTMKRAPMDVGKQAIYASGVRSRADAPGYTITSYKPDIRDVRVVDDWAFEWGL